MTTEAFGPDAGADALARVIDATARAVPGVRELYSAGPLAIRALGMLTDRDVAYARVAESPDGYAVTLSVGVPADADAARVAADVAAAVREAAPGIGLVTVRISRFLADPE